MPVARARHAIGVVVICSIVDRVRTDDGGNLFVTKGGSAMQMRLGLVARATTDLDFLFRGGASQWLDHLDEALLGGGWNGFDVHRKNEPTEIEVPGLRYKPWRLNLQLAYKGKAFSTVQVEIAMDSVSGVDRDDIVEGIDLGWFGIDAPPIPCLSIAYQMAQKLHPCTDPHDRRSAGERPGPRPRGSFGCLNRCSTRMASLTSVLVRSTPSRGEQNRHGHRHQSSTTPGGGITRRSPKKSLAHRRRSKPPPNTSQVDRTR
jgi:Nucleotidyl transferase AbiEii toxin, Type IV TA system